MIGFTQRYETQAVSRSRASGKIFCYDNVYRDSLGQRAWRRLKPEVRCRFSVRPAGNGRIRYRGIMSRVELTFMGWCFAQACRLIGSPLAPCCGRNVPMRIVLSEDAQLGGVAWKRTYLFANRRPFTVVSTKTHEEKGGVTEHIGSGFSMRLKLQERSGGLVFVSTGYDVSFFGLRFRIPNLLTPGVTTVTHEQIKGSRFRFSLSVDHPILGRTIFQEGEFYSD